MFQHPTHPFMSKLAIVLFVLAIAWCLLPVPTTRADGITVTLTSPVGNAFNITPTTTISATFSHPISAATATSLSFAVRGLQSGWVTGTHGVINDDTIVVTPTHAFHAGEVVIVNASSQIEGNDGIPLTPYAWQFTVDTRYGGGNGDYKTEQLVDGAFDGAWHVYAADMDGDGDLDVLGAARSADDIAWWENTHGDGATWIEHTVDAAFDEAHSVYAADVDNDGDLDVLGAARSADDITWWENTHGDGTTWVEHTVDAAFDGAESVYAADVDNDGDLDVLGAAYDADDIAWWENTYGDGTTWVEHSVDDAFDGATNVYAADVDNDGDLDVLGAAYGADDVAWWENGSRDGTTWIEHTVDAAFDGAASVYAADMDGDGDLDILGAAYFADDITWWENATGDGITWVEHTVDAAFDGARSVYAADVDSDGDLDILSAAHLADAIVWWENGAGDGMIWSAHTVDGAFDTAMSVYAADVDGDGTLDVLGAALYADDITIWLNESRKADLVLEKSFIPRAPLPGAVITYTLSFSNAGDATARGVVITDSIPVSVTHSSLRYTYSGASITATSSISYVWAVQDLAPDNGGVITISGVLSDALGVDISNRATITTASVERHPDDNSSLAILPFAVTVVTPPRNNLNVTTTSTISAAFNVAVHTGTIMSHTLTVRGLQSGIYTGSYSFPAENVVLFDPVARFKAGEVVMVSASSQIKSSDGIPLTPYAWQFTVGARHGNGDGDYRTEQLVDGAFDGVMDTYAADMDGDGDLDVLGAAFYANTIAWWENTTSGGTTWVKHTVDGAFNGADGVYAADVDGDGDLDILGAARSVNDIVWWENANGHGTTWIEHSVDVAFSAVRSVYAADVDGDGDLDVLGGGAAGIAWWENANGDGIVWVKHNVAGAFELTESVYAADVDGDGDLDVLGAVPIADDITWWENADQTGPGTGDGTIWIDHTVVAAFDGAESVYAADMDSDGDLDVLGAASVADAIIWWENATGDGTAWVEHSVDGAFNGAVGVYTADVDGDSDLDVVGAAASADTIAWWENVNGDSTVWVEHSVAGAFDRAESVYAADVDGDGDLDILGAAENGDDIAIWLNEPAQADLLLKKYYRPRAPLPGDTVTYTLSFANTGTAVARGVIITDSIPVSVTRSSLCYTYSGAAITATGSISYVWQVQDLIPGAGGVITVTGVLSDLLAVGIPNSATITTTSVDYNPDNNSDSVTLPFAVTAVTPLKNDLNVMTASTISATFNGTVHAGTVTYHTLTARGLQSGSYTGSYSFPAENVAFFDPANRFKAGEVVMVNASAQIESSEGTTLTTYTWQFTVDTRHGSGDGDYRIKRVVDGAFNGARSVYAADMDGDGDLDVLGAAYLANAIAWWENTISDGTTWIEHMVVAAFAGANSVYAADMDGDGDLDVVGAGLSAETIAWWENVNGDGLAWIRHTVDGAFSMAMSVYAEDVDGDGDLDILGTSAATDKIAWWENENGNGTTWIRRSVDNNFNGPVGISVADMDSDGDLDILGAAIDGGDVAWWANGDQTGPGTGDGTIWVEHSVNDAFNGAAGVYAADMDSDGDLDVLSAGYYAGDIAWWENMDRTGPGTGDGTIWIEHGVDRTFGGAYSVYAGDLDGDGDLDVLGAGTTVVWWENVNQTAPGTGNGTVWVKHNTDGASVGSMSVYAADVDGDGDLDILDAAYGLNEITVWLNEPGQADLTLSQLVVPQVPLPGDRLTYTLSFANVGMGAATGVVITDVLPISVTHTSVISSGVPLTPQVGTRYVWNVADLAPRTGGILTLTGVLSDALPAGLLRNQAYITSTVLEADTSNNTAWADVLINGSPINTTLTDLSTGAWLEFGDGICGRVYFSDTTSVLPTALIITYTASYPTANMDGLPRRYDIVAVGGAGIQAQVMLCYADVELSVAGIDPAQEAALHIYRYTGGGAWQAYSQVDTVNNTVTAAGITDFGVFGMGVTGDTPTTLTLHSLVVSGSLWGVGTIGALMIGVVLMRRRKVV